MATLLALDSVALESGSPTLTLSLNHGRSVGVYGAGNAAKSDFLLMVGGRLSPATGKAIAKPSAYSELPDLGKRATPLTLAKELAGASGATRAAEALAALRLWDERKSLVSNLTLEQKTACSLLPVLAGSEKLLLIDGVLDRLDPWTLSSTFELISHRLREGAALVVSTNRPEWASRFDTLVVLDQRRIAFVGSMRDLERKEPTSEVVVETSDQQGVRALTDPFEFTVEESDQGICYRAAEGQALAAKLLVEGYGDIKSVVLRRPDAATLLRNLLS